MRPSLLLGTAGGAIARISLIIGAISASGTFAKLTLVQNNNTATDSLLRDFPSLATQDYFETTTPDYNYTGLLLLPRFRSTVNQQNCGLAFNRTGDSIILADTNLTHYKGSVIGINWEDAATANCNTYAQLTKAVATYASNLERSGYPVANMLLIFTTVDKDIAGDYSGPYSDPYSSYHLIDLDGSPAITTALVPSIASDNVYTRLRQAQYPMTVNVAKELGRWNEIFLNRDFITFRYVACAFSAVVTLVSAVRFIQRAARNDYSFGPVQVAHLLGIIAGICFTITLPIRLVTSSTYLLKTFDSLFYGGCFYIQLLIWHRTIRDMISNMNIAIASLFYSCHVALLVEVFCFITNTVNMGRSTMSGHDEALRIAAGARVALMCIYALIALLLIGIGVANKEMQQSIDIITRAQIKRFNLMARLALPGFLYMIAQGIYSSMSLSQRNNWNAHKHMDVFVTLTVFGIIRGIGLVALVSLNNPVPLRQSMMSRKSMMSKLTETASEMTSTGEKMEDLELPGITRPNKSWGQLFSRGVSTLA